MNAVRTWINTLNTTWHERALWFFTAVVLAHWTEHVVQAIQVFVLGWPRPASRGVLGQWFPWLVKSESLHYFFAIFMLIGLALLLPGFQGKARFWWTVALVIQFWHHIEHLLLLYQRVTGDFFWGQHVPTSILQHWVMRIELHLFYNAAVTIPMVIAVVLHMFPPESERDLTPQCTCRKHFSRRQVQAEATA